MGVRWSYAVGRFVGDMMFRFLNRQRQRAIDHICQSFPDWPEEKCVQVARRSMRNMAYLGIEMMLTTRLVTPGNWRRYVEFEDMSEGMLIMLERKSGQVCIAGHFGGWEVNGYAMAMVGFPGYAVFRPLDNPYINRHIMGIRQARGLVLLDKSGAMQSMDAILGGRQYVGFIADQDAGPRGLFVDFFGRAASTYKAPALTAMRYNVPVMVGYARRIGETYRFRIGAQRIIYPHEWADKDDPLRWITQEYTTALEQIVRSAPEQYLWSYRRWKNRPKGEKPAGGAA